MISPTYVMNSFFKNLGNIAKDKNDDSKERKSRERS